MYCLPLFARRRHPEKDSFAAQWLAYAPPCQRFAETLAGNCALLGADVDRYSFIVRDLHSLLLAGLPALRKSSPLCLTERASLFADGPIPDSCDAARGLIRSPRRWRPAGMCGMVSPRALAVFRLMTSWNFV